MQEKSQTVATPVSGKKRAMVYVDGFNLYFGVFRYRPAMKWPNFTKYFRTIRPDNDIVGIRYCTAIVDPKAEKSDTRDRQEALLKAFTAFPKMSVTFGKYQDRTVTCRGSCEQKYVVAEEKKTDVNIAVRMIEDALREEMDDIILVSGDSDLEPVVEFVHRHRPKIGIHVYIPTIPGEGEPVRRNDYYRSIGVAVRDLPYKEFAHCQMPETVTCPDGSKVTRPTEWK